MLQPNSATFEQALLALQGPLALAAFVQRQHIPCLQCAGAGTVQWDGY